LYLFLVCVGDDRGISYYGDQTLMTKLSMDTDTFENARSDLIRSNLIAWKSPLYQVLCLEPATPRRMASPMGLGEILKTAMKEAS
jgi:hypothetical protein